MIQLQVLICLILATTARPLVCEWVDIEKLEQECLRTLNNPFVISFQANKGSFLNFSIFRNTPTGEVKLTEKIFYLLRLQTKLQNDFETRKPASI